MSSTIPHTHGGSTRLKLAFYDLICHAVSEMIFEISGYIEGLGKNYRNSILSTFSTTQKLIYFFRMISGKSEFGIYAG